MVLVVVNESSRVVVNCSGSGSGETVRVRGVGWLWSTEVARWWSTEVAVVRGWRWAGVGVEAVGPLLFFILLNKQKE